MAGIEKKIGNILDRIIEAESRAVIARYESEVEKLELVKLVLNEKTASCARLRGTTMKLFEPLSSSSQTLGIFGEVTRSTTSGSC
jgi:hypothetical protein